MKKRHQHRFKPSGNTAITFDDVEPHTHRCKDRAKPNNNKQGVKKFWRMAASQGGGFSRLQSESLLLRCHTIIIRLKARLQPNIRLTLRRVLAMFVRSAITSPKENRFWWNLEHSEYIVGGWIWQILDAIRAVATTGELGEILFLFCRVSKHDFSDFPLAKFHETRTQHVDQCSDENIRNRILKILP